MPDKIMLIDGHSLLNRAFYALPILTNKDGEYTNAVYGFLNIFFKLFDEERPKYALVAFDLPQPTFRHLKYEAYKGTRKSMPDELRPQVPLLKSLLKKMNICVCEQEGLEADDLLGTLAKRAEADGLEAVIVSGDRDLLQIASERIKIRIPKTRAGKTEVEDYNAADVVEKMGVAPLEYIEVKALMGDTSDNIPGVPGIGEKTATKIIQDYKSVENAIAHADDIKPKKASENLRQFAEQARLSKFLATIVVDADYCIAYDAASTDKIYNPESLNEIRRLNFKTLIGRFSANPLSVQNEQKAQPEAAGKYLLINDPAGLERQMDKLRSSPHITMNLVFLAGECAGLSFAADGIDGAFIPQSSFFLAKNLAGLPNKKVMLDSKRDVKYFESLGIEVENICFDVSLAAYVLNASLGSYQYYDIAEYFLDERAVTPDELLGKPRSGKAKKKPDELTEQELLNFGAVQADIINRAYPLLDAALSENGQEKLYYGMELPLAAVLRDMEQCGIKVNRQALISYGDALDGHIESLTAEIYEMAGEPFNVNSPAQLGIILFERLGLKSGKKNTQGYSTAADVLEKLADKHPIISKILEYRTYAKLKSTYVDGLLEVTDGTSKIHSTFNQTIASTGRLSSTEPNLQNIPIRLELGRQLRKVFVPTDDSFVFLDGDYSQIELRVLAHMSGDETMIAAFQNGEDIHRLTASQAFNVPLEMVTDRQRSNAKAVNFGIVYGISSYSLSQDLGISKNEADRYIAGYFEKYPKIKEYLDKTISEARTNGYASTIFNRRRAIPELSSSNFNMRSFGERVAMNMPVQGSAADIIKIAMINVHRVLREKRLDSRIILQVHDELLLEVKKDELDEVKRILKDEMENAVDLKVKMKVDLHDGDTWYEAK